MLHCHAFHLDEPGWTADGCVGDDEGHLRESLGEDVADHGVVGYVTEVDDDLHDIGEIGSSFMEKLGDVLEHALCLTDDVAYVEDIAFVVDAGCAGDEVLGTVGIGDGGASLEGDSIFVGGIEVGLGIEVALLSRSESED